MSSITTSGRSARAHDGPLPCPCSAKLLRSPVRLYLDAIQHGARSTTPPARGDQPDPVPSRRKATEDLEQMDLGASRMGIFPILPVHQQDVHKRPSE